jgi:antitoxin ParD1/3/4
MDIPLTPVLEQLINEKVNSGRYYSASEVIGEALRLLDERDRKAQAVPGLSHSGTETC